MAILSKKLQKLSSFWGLRPYTSSATRLVALVSSVSHLIIQTFFEQTIFSLYGPSLPPPPPPLGKSWLHACLRLLTYSSNFIAKIVTNINRKKIGRFRITIVFIKNFLKSFLMF